MMRAQSRPGHPTRSPRAFAILVSRQRGLENLNHFLNSQAAQEPAGAEQPWWPEGERAARAAPHAPCACPALSLPRPWAAARVAAQGLACVACVVGEADALGVHGQGGR